MKKYKIIFIIAIFVFCPQMASATNYNPSYPRIGAFQWYGAPPAMYARYDLVDFNFDTAKSSTPREIKVINPNVIILGTKEWRICGRSGCPEEWQIKTSEGEPIKIPGMGDYADPTDYCGEYNNQKFNEYLPQSYVDEFDFNYVDGVASNGLHRYAGDLISFSKRDVDLNRDGVNDLEDPGSNWLEVEFRKGVDKLVSNMRNILANNGLTNRPLLINTGALEEWANGEINGWIDEYASTLRYWGQGFIKRYSDIIAKVRKPKVVIINGLIDEKDDFKDMRFLLTETLMSDGYFDCEELRSKEHYYKEYYDEFDVELGYPEGSYQKLPNGVYVRFFTKGVAITNPQGEAKIITDGMLKNLNGYNGPYYHFKGGQDPGVNNGQMFKSFSLFGEKRPDSGNNNRYYGDGIILLKESKEVVADIIIDHTSSFTSAGSQKSELVGNWEESCCRGSVDKCSKSWTWGCRHSYVNDTYDIAKSLSQTAYAIFKPTIGLPGKYKVFEWHPEEQSATQIDYEIYYFSKTESGTIDQSKNYNQWNLLGEYHFSQGTDNYVKISNPSSGLLIADAFKFVYQGSLGLLTDFNCDGQVNIQDFGILLSYWGQKTGLNNYQHPQCSQTKNLDLVPNNIIDASDLASLLSCWGSPESERCYE